MIYPAHQEAIIEGRAYRILRGVVSLSLVAFNLSMPEWTLLGLLCDHEEMRQNEMASMLMVEAPLVTLQVKQLLEKGMVHMEIDAEDNRARLITPTELGKKTLPLVNDAVHTALAPYMTSISSQDIAAYFRVLQQIISNSSAKQA
jgi:MarR family transcriptional regulator for hemolysin